MSKTPPTPPDKEFLPDGSARRPQISPAVRKPKAEPITATPAAEAKPAKVAISLGKRVRNAISRVAGSAVSTEHDWLKDGFQLIEPDMEDFLTEAPPRWIRDTHYMAILLLFLLIITACLVRVDIVIVGTGRLASDEPPIVVQPMQLSMIREIKVKAGDVVKKGDVLATLDATFTQADKSSLSAQHTSLKSEIARVEAEVNNTPLELAEDSPENILQINLYRKRQSQYKAKLEEFDQRIERYKNDIRSLESNRVSLTNQLRVAKEAEQMRATLYKNQTGSKMQLLDAQTTRIRTERDLQDGINRLDEVQHNLKTADSERQAFVDEWHRLLLESLVKLRSDVSTTSENLTKAERLNDLVVLRAPEDCVVLEIAKRSVGSVLHEAEPFATLIPVNAQLIADITINSADVGYAKSGDDVVIKVDSFPYQRHGFLYGKVRSIGEDSFSAGGGSTPLNPTQTAPMSSAGIFHHSQVTLNDTNLKDLPTGTRLIPGMTLTAEIKVGTRSVISYFLYPVTRGLHESIREP